MRDELENLLLDGTLGRRTVPVIEERDPDHLRHVTLARLVVEMSKAAATAKPLDPIGEVIQQAMGAACTVFVVQDQNVQTGSGFLVDGGIVLTNHHVLPTELEGAAITVSFDGRTALPASVVRVNPEVDAAALSVGDVEVRPVQLSSAGATPGEVVAVIGAPEGWQDVVTVGRVSAVDRTAGDDMGPSWQGLMFIDADILEGSSGSMVIDVTGRVVGMVMGMIGRHAQELGIGQRAVIPVQRVIEGLGL